MCVVLRDLSTRRHARGAARCDGASTLSRPRRKPSAQATEKGKRRYFNNSRKTSTAFPVRVPFGPREL
ncbi:hypothetical protein XA68_10712 [Ophiocordyceps unilateralis]|uniref:Uncharacterized protein n=1 Tax=Ophiocordyceps unilateralis TaxID=268505 RepID=A0A2A9PPJ5_OPHUN|nr:hypothetical protein XA68_10712 [Ophiocordyceps unilateralis]